MRRMLPAAHTLHLLFDVAFFGSIFLNSITNAQFLPLPEVPFQFEELEPYFNGMDTRRHYHEVFGHYVERFNAVLGQLRHTAAYKNILKKGGFDLLLARIEEVPSALRRKLRYHAGGYVNHELFFRTLRPAAAGGGDLDGNNMPDGLVLAAIEQSFGSFATFRDELTNVARRILGSGWAWLVVDTSTTVTKSSADVTFPLLVVETAVNDHPLMTSPSYSPLLCLDVWEHAYFGQFHNNRRQYIEAWWGLVNWEEVGNILGSLDFEARVSGIVSPILDFTSDATAEVAATAKPGAMSAASFTSAVLYEDEQYTLRPPEAAPRQSGRCDALEALMSDFQPQPRSTMSVQLECNQTTASCQLCRHIVAKRTAVAGDVLLVWPSKYVLSARGTLRDSLRSLRSDTSNDTLKTGSRVVDDLLVDAVAALVTENRRTDSLWHAYLSYLHDEFEGAARESALFWPVPLLHALNATVGLHDLRAAARAHRAVVTLFGETPGLLTRDGTGSTQPLFDTEVHWAVAVALSRGVSDARLDTLSMLPGSELLSRGDAIGANVEIRLRSGVLPVSTIADAGSEAANSSNIGRRVGDASGPRDKPTAIGADDVGGTWELAAVRHISPGEALVLDAGMSNVELLSRGWAAIEGNSHGPALALPASVQAVAKLASAAQTRGDRGTKLGAKWHRLGCERELRAPRLVRTAAGAGGGDPRLEEPKGLPPGLLLCIAYAVRLRDALKARKSHQGMASTGAHSSKHVHKERALVLIARACRHTHGQYKAAMAMLLDDGGTVRSSIAAAFQAALAVDIALLEQCIGAAQR